VFNRFAWLAACSSLCVVSFACSDDDTNSSDDAATVADAGRTDPSPNQQQAGSEAKPTKADETTLPIVFVHGFAGSAQQFQSQGMRFVANGYPAERLHAYEHDGAGAAGPDFVSGLDAVVDEARSKFKTEKVYLIGHSRGTSVSSMYLSESARADKVAKYIALDGAGCANISVPCIAPAQSTNMRAGQTHPLPNQKHVEVATSKESFAVQYEFLFDRAPEVVDIVKQSTPVVISGRAVNFPANTGRDGATLEIWEVASDTGLRSGDKALATIELGADGNWGPVTVSPDKHYEAVLKSKDTPNQHHFYAQPFLRSSPFVRFLSGPPESDSRKNTNTGDRHTALNAMRQREWTTDDELKVRTRSKSGDQDERQVITAEITNNPISIFLHDDAATPGESSLKLLPWFPQQPFQNGVDVYMPGNDEPDGTVQLINLPRGAKDKPQTLNVPNWASTRHSVTVMFSDFPQD